MFTYMPLGGCPLNNPLASLIRRKLASSLQIEMGFRRTLVSLSSGGAVQLTDFLRGTLAIPKWVRHMCYGDPSHVPSSAQRSRLKGVEIVFIEMSTPIELVFDGFLLNQNRFKETAVADLFQYGEEARRLAMRWVNEGLQKQNEEARQAASTALLNVIPPDTEKSRNLRETVARTHGRHVRQADIYADLKRVVETLNKPAVVILHNFSYMPDGRPIIFPADFKENSRAAAMRLGLPCYDPAVIVSKHWGQNVMMADMRHYSRPFNAVIADEYLRLAQIVLPKLLFGREVERWMAA